MSKVSLIEGSSLLQLLGDFCWKVQQDGEALIQGMVENDSLRKYILKCAKDWPANKAKEVVGKAAKDSILSKGVRNIYTLSSPCLPYGIEKVDFQTSSGIKFASLLPSEIAITAQSIRTQNYPNIAYLTIDVDSLPSAVRGLPSLILVIQFGKVYRYDIYRIAKDERKIFAVHWAKVIIVDSTELTRDSLLLENIEKDLRKISR